MKRIISVLIMMTILAGCFSLPIIASDLEENDTNNGAEDNLTSNPSIELSAKSAILIEAQTGAVLYSKDAHLALPPASVTKIMTLLIVAESINAGVLTLDQTVTVSENAASKGGSQIFIKEGEEFTVEELLKSTVIASANDAAVALAELVAGSESEFVRRMNARAKELGMKNTEFENCTGLDDSVTKHLTSAYDISIMSRELIKHDIILKYSSVWQDSIRDGEFVLTNTNRLVRYYAGCTGLKTGSTDKAGYCVSASAKRDGMHLIAVIMGAESRDKRNADARVLLDYGFSAYALYHEAECEVENVPLKRSDKATVPIYAKEFAALVDRANIKRIEKKYIIPESLVAPLERGAVIGEVKYLLDGSEIGKSEIYLKDDAEEINYVELLLKLLRLTVCGK